MKRRRIRECSGCSEGEVEARGCWGWVGDAWGRAASGPAARVAVAGVLVSALLGVVRPATAATDGQKLLKEGRYADARIQLASEVAATPEDARLLRDLGIAELRTGEIGQARTNLRKAVSRLPRDAGSHYFLGVALEESDSLSAALAEYGVALGQSPRRGLRRDIEARMRSTTWRLLRAQALSAVQRENELDLRSVPDNTLAVLTFHNVSASSRLAPLSTGLAAMLATDLSRVRALRLIEREKLPVILRELELQQTEVFDPATRSRIGLLLGARRLVKGLFVVKDDETLELASSLVDTETGEVSVEGTRAGGQLEQIFHLEKLLVFGVIESLGITPSPRERAEIEQMPTKNLLAFLAYCRGLELEDAGDLSGALAEYRQAVEIDSSFDMARERLESAAGELRDFAALDRAMVDGAFRPPEAVVGRLRYTGQRTGESFIPEASGHQGETQVPRTTGVEVVEQENRLPPFPPPPGAQSGEVP